MKEPVMPEQKQTRSTPPYLPYATFKNFLDSLKAGIPGQIDRSVMRSMSGSAQSMLIGSLRFFDLISEDGKPSPMLGKLVNAEPVDRQKILHGLIETAYPFMFGGGMSLKTATPKQVTDAFADAGVSGDTIRKAVVFFLSAAKDADIPLSPFLKVRQPGRPPGGSVKRRVRPVALGAPSGANKGGAANGMSEKTPYEMLIGILDPDHMEKEEQDAVWTLIRYLKKQETGE